MLPSDIVVLSHLRWVFVWQRPQHLISRLARAAPTWFVEEPQAVGGISEPRLRHEQHGDVTRVWLEVPGPERHICFSDPAATAYAALLREHLGSPPDRAVWLYTPMAWPLGQSLAPRLTVYDVMDDLASFRGAPPSLRSRQEEALTGSDLVFTGGRSLQRSVAGVRPDAHCFPSGVDAAHYAPASVLRRAQRNGRLGRSVAGYVGVIDERLDLDLIARLAVSLPDWDFRMVGPVAKIDPSELPAAPNITYPGPADYGSLPEVMAGFDVGLMPFALNDATRCISPTKTLEYLAAGLPVVSTRVPDVVSSFGDVVDLADDAAGFAAACQRVLKEPPATRAANVAPFLSWHNWDAIARRMTDLMRDANAARHQGQAPSLAAPRFSAQT